MLARAELTAPRLADLAELDDAAFRRLFSKLAGQAHWAATRFLRNVLIAVGNSGRPELAEAARAAAGRSLAAGPRHGGLGARTAVRPTVASRPNGARERRWKATSPFDAEWQAGADAAWASQGIPSGMLSSEKLNGPGFFHTVLRKRCMYRCHRRQSGRPPDLAEDEYFLIAGELDEASPGRSGTASWRSIERSHSLSDDGKFLSLAF